MTSGNSANPAAKAGPWLDTPVKAGAPSDPFLASGFDQKRLTVSHQSKEPVTVKIEADFTGDGVWTEFTTLTVPAGQPLDYAIPDAFGAYWLRLVSGKDTTATGQFRYD